MCGMRRRRIVYGAVCGHPRPDPVFISPQHRSDACHDDDGYRPLITRRWNFQPARRPPKREPGDPTSLADRAGSVSARPLRAASDRSVVRTIFRRCVRATANPGGLVFKRLPRLNVAPREPRLNAHIAIASVYVRFPSTCACYGCGRRSSGPRWVRRVFYVLCRWGTHCGTELLQGRPYSINHLQPFGWERNT